jgi:hypothetical protein
MTDDIEESLDELDDESTNAYGMVGLHDPLELIEKIYYLWMQWADFHLYVVEPAITPIVPPYGVEPEVIDPETGEKEFVYVIQDHGYKLSSSRAEDMFDSSMSMCKLYNTIEKMIALLVERLRTGGIEPDAEVQVAFSGHELAQRKAFESIINLQENVVVTNFEPGEWGEKYLKVVKNLADKGYGYPPESPRDTYRRSHQGPNKGLTS